MEGAHGLPQNKDAGPSAPTQQGEAPGSASPGEPVGPGPGVRSAARGSLSSLQTRRRRERVTFELHMFACVFKKKWKSLRLTVSRTQF